MGASITLAGESLIAQKLGSQQRLDVVRFIFANVPGLDPNAPVNRSAGKPPAAEIVHSYTIPQQNVGYVNPNQVVYSSMLGSDIGDFDWNWIGLETAENVLLAVAYMPLQQKRRNIPPLQLGNNVTRNILVVFDGAQALTGITIDAKTWQHDFTVRLKGVDERERLSNRDVFGRACFFESAFQVEKVGTTYQLKPGLAYVEGIRVELAAAVAIVPTKMPTQAWLQVSLRRELNDVVATWKVDFESNQVDSLDANGQRVYCIALADLTTAVISDRRVVEPINGALIQHLAARNGDYQYLRARATTKDDVGLGNLPNAISDDANTNSSLILATTKALNSVRSVLQLAIEKLISGATPAGKAKQLETARTLAISGAAAGSATFDGSANVDIKLTMPDIVAAWKYTKVTVNSKGLVTQGENLQAVDVPPLDWAKITTGTPTTLAGYGIKDAQPLAQLLSDYVKNKGWGLGQSEPLSIADANEALLPGFYSAAGSGAKNFADNFSPLLVLKRMSGPMGQIQLNPRDNLLYHRGSNNGGESWTNWESAWNTGNLKKTTSAIDTTAGSMLRVGDFGIGAMAIHPEVDLNKLLTAGKFLSAANPSGVPVGWPAGRSLIDVTGGASYAMQMLASTTARRVAIRTTSGDEVYSWMELWHSENHVAASKAEAEDGTSLERWMSPGRVFQAIAKKVVQAKEALVGVAAIATQALVNAGDDDATIVTPKKLRFGFSISLAENGYIVFPTWMGSLILQWGNFAAVPSNHLVDVTYPIAFPTAVRFSIGGFLGDAGTTGTDAVSVTTRSRVGMTLRCAGDNGALPVNWLAFGH